jgi:hypothetical protein
LETLDSLEKEKGKPFPAFPLAFHYLDLPPARFERTASGLGILRSIHLSYGGLRNISYLQLYFSPSVSICANACLTVFNQPFQIAQEFENLISNAERIKQGENPNQVWASMPRRMRKKFAALG